MCVLVDNVVVHVYADSAIGVGQALLAISARCGSPTPFPNSSLSHLLLMLLLPHLPESGHLIAVFVTYPGTSPGSNRSICPCLTHGPLLHALLSCL